MYLWAEAGILLPTDRSGAQGGAQDGVQGGEVIGLMGVVITAHTLVTTRHR